MGLDESNSTYDEGFLARWILPAGMAVVAFVLSLGAETAREWLRFDRVWLAHGEAWRWLTGHLVHLGWSHFALNVTGLGLVWYLVGRRYSVSAWLFVIGMTIAVIDAGFWFFNPELHWYVGLSGLLHGMLAAGLATRFPRVDFESALLAVLLVAKLIWELVSGPMPGSELTSGGAVVVDAHFYGALGGLTAAFLIRIRDLCRASI